MENNSTRASDDDRRAPHCQSEGVMAMRLEMKDAMKEAEFYIAVA
jgi:hypothetical protein